MSNAELTAARDALVLALDTAFDAAPTNSAWKAMCAIEQALEAFDVAHPEILAAIQADHAAEMASRYQD